MSDIIRSIRGMNDILPEQTHRWEVFEAMVRDWMSAYNYQSIRTPILEHTPLFSRAIGESTDIVEKEMYSFHDQLNREQLTLRPEGTAACVRSALQHHFLYDGPRKLWYMGPMFRHERPQKGRFRQFHQVGIESMGYPGPDIDAEHILMCANLWQRMGLSNVRLQLNCLGTLDERSRYRHELVRWLGAREESLDPDARRRIRTNPLRVLDSKHPETQQVIKEAPELLHYLDEASMRHFEGLQALLTSCGITFEINKALVRGLDYYGLTVFEWTSDNLGAQGTICAGGRYDGLFEQLKGKPQTACGFALGIERVMDLWPEHQSRPGPHVYVMYHGKNTSTYALQAAERLRSRSLNVHYHCGGGSFKSQMKRADNAQAQYALIVGEQEIEAQQVSIKPLREEKAQTRIAFDYLQEWADAIHSNHCKIIY